MAALGTRWTGRSTAARRESRRDRDTRHLKYIHSPVLTRRFIHQRRRLAAAFFATAPRTVHHIHRLLRWHASRVSSRILTGPHKARRRAPACPAASSLASILCSRDPHGRRAGSDLRNTRWRSGPPSEGLGASFTISQPLSFAPHAVATTASLSQSRSPESSPMASSTTSVSSSLLARSILGGS